MSPDDNKRTKAAPCLVHKNEKVAPSSLKLRYIKDKYSHIQEPVIPYNDVSTSMSTQNALQMSTNRGG